MSEAGFHVHGPHDHAVEHQAQHGDAFAGRIAVQKEKKVIKAQAEKLEAEGKHIGRS